MSTTFNSGKAADQAPRGSVPIIAIVAAVIVLAVFIFILARHYAGSPELGTVASDSGAPAAHETSDTAFLRQKARECAGDMTKLSAEDQQRVQKITRSNGALVLKSMSGGH